MKDYFQFLESGVFVGVVCVCVYPIVFLSEISKSPGECEG